MPRNLTTPDMICAPMSCFVSDIIDMLTNEIDRNDNVIKSITYTHGTEIAIATTMPTLP